MNETANRIFSSVEDAPCSQNLSDGDRNLGTSHTAIVAVFSSLLAIVILIGNGLIIVSVCLVRKLRQPANYLIVSLAFSDFLVAFIVLPVTVVYDILGEWVFGSTLCNIHVSVDVICCATSILNLVMISIDRYLMITRPFWYPKKRTAKLMGSMIVCVWVLGCLVIFPALFGFTKNATDDPGFINLTLTDHFQHNSTTRGPFNASIAKETVLHWTPCRNEERWQATVDLNKEHSIHKSVRTTLADTDLLLEMTLIRENVSDTSQKFLFFTSSTNVTTVNEKARFIRISMSETQREQFANTSLDLYAEKVVGRNCLISQEKWFTIYSTLSSFYIPLAIMLFMYYKIYLEASRLEARQRARSRSLSDDRNERVYSVFSEPTKRKKKNANIVVDSSSDLMDYFEMRRRSSDTQRNCSNVQDTDIARCEQSGSRQTVSSRDDDTCKILPTGGGCEPNDTDDAKSANRFVTSCEVNGNSEQNAEEQCKTQHSRSWCKTLHYSNSSVSQSDGSGMNSQSSRTSHNRGRSLTTNGNCESPLRRSILSTRRKSYHNRSHSISYRSERKRSSFLRRNLSIQREKMRNVKAIRTLGIIVVVFTVCWLPFFVLTFLRPFICSDPESADCLPAWLVRLVLWLGYINSAMNPIIYVGFNSDLRDTFVLLLLCKCANVDRRLARGEVRRAIENEKKYNATL